IGTIKDENKAFIWLLRAAECEEPYSQFVVGTCYNDGIGTAKNSEKVLEWFVKAAEGGNIMALQFVSELLSGLFA
ncbi:28665_t:CDS:1, partial [Racocetra persica]